MLLFWWHNENWRLNLDNILIDEKSHENILVYNISCKTLIDANSLCVRLDKIHEFIRSFDGTRYLVLFGCDKYDSIYNRIRCFIMLKSGITYIVPHSYSKIKIDSYSSLPLENTMTFHDVAILIKSVFSKDESNYYYTVLLEKTWDELPKK